MSEKHDLIHHKVESRTIKSSCLKHGFTSGSWCHTLKIQFYIWYIWTILSNTINDSFTWKYHHLSPGFFSLLSLFVTISGRNVWATNIWESLKIKTGNWFVLKYNLGFTEIYHRNLCFRLFWWNYQGFGSGNSIFLYFKQFWIQCMARKRFISSISPYQSVTLTLITLLLFTFHGLYWRTGKLLNETLQ